jgi:hypothetical protein
MLKGCVVKNQLPCSMQRLLLQESLGPWFTRWEMRPRWTRQESLGPWFTRREMGPRWTRQQLGLRFGCRERGAQLIKSRWPQQGQTLC